MTHIIMSGAIRPFTDVERAFAAAKKIGERIVEGERYLRGYKVANLLGWTVRTGVSDCASRYGRRTIEDMDPTQDGKLMMVTFYRKDVLQTVERIET